MNPTSWSVNDYDFILSSEVRNSPSCVGQVSSYLMVYIDFFVQLAESIGRFRRTCKSYEARPHQPFWRCLFLAVKETIISRWNICVLSYSRKMSM
jgi:hypothetical protein